MQRGEILILYSLLSNSFSSLPVWYACSLYGYTERATVCSPHFLPAGGACPQTEGSVGKRTHRFDHYVVLHSFNIGESHPVLILYLPIIDLWFNPCQAPASTFSSPQCLHWTSATNQWTWCWSSNVASWKSFPCWQTTAVLWWTRACLPPLHLDLCFWVGLSD